MKPHVEMVRAALTAAARVNPQGAAGLEGRRIAIEVPGERLVIVFAGAGAVSVVSDDDGECDATLRGSLAGVLAHLAGREGAAAMGDGAVVDGFLALVRPRLPEAPDVRTLGEDVGDAVRLGVRAAQSVLQTVAGDPSRAGGEESATLEARIADLERRVERLEGAAGDETDEGSPRPEQ